MRPVGGRRLGPQVAGGGGVGGSAFQTDRRPEAGPQVARGRRRRRRRKGEEGGGTEEKTEASHGVRK